MNGVPKNDSIWKSIAGYCEQVDLHNPAMSVRESLIFAARARLRPFSLPDHKKISFAMKIMNLLALDDFADMLVGDESSGEGLPKHARKRLTVGVELAANPSILFGKQDLLLPFILLSLFWISNTSHTCDYHNDNHHS